MLLSSVSGNMSILHQKKGNYLDWFLVLVKPFWLGDYCFLYTSLLIEKDNGISNSFPPLFIAIAWYVFVYVYVHMFMCVYAGWY